ncbi:LysM domain-containing protein [Colletotrichum nymphaeae SA-01]|uniref:LysM domain-containing protein n=1 Tax=Colletotrichum nymphaeae SA-01 TaxID=1460502 RepID=A0A135TYE0_9PEZI|nr:LysM domain-containing protein [Colletotrichum nymphaeae SA-01]
MKSIVALSLTISLWPMAIFADPSFFFFTNQSGTVFDGISSGCNLALSAPVPECPRELLNLLGGGSYHTVLNETVMGVLCRSECSPALATYRSNVVSQCAKDPQPRSGYPPTYWVDSVTAVRTQMCLKDSKTGEYCTQYLERVLGDATSPTDLLGGYSTAQLCSECLVSLFRHQQSTPYSNYDPEMAQAWAAIQSKCSLSLPTATQTLKTNVTSLGNYAPPGYATAVCVAGRTYTQVIAWNPTVDSYCTNMIAGQNICVGPPGGVLNFTTIPGATVTKTAIYATATADRPAPVASGTTTKCGKYYKVQLANVFYCVLPTQDWNTTATSTTVPAPTTTPPGTTDKCYQWYVIQSGDYCAKVQDKFAISFEQFRAWNPAIASDCSNLQLGVAYCVQGAAYLAARATVDAGSYSDPNQVAHYRRNGVGPIETGVSESEVGGVAIGWPGVDSPRLRRAMGL